MNEKILKLSLVFGEVEIWREKKKKKWIETEERDYENLTERSFDFFVTVHLLSPSLRLVQTVLCIT